MIEPERNLLSNQDDKNCESKCKLCGLNREDPHYNALYRHRYGHKFCICLCHSPFSPRAKGLFSNSFYSKKKKKFTIVVDKNENI